MIKIIYGLKENEKEYMETILFESEKDYDENIIIEKAKKDGYIKFRIAIIDKNEKPDFLKALNI